MNPNPPNAPAVTLANCDSEPIHIPGAIQPQGALIAIDRGGVLRHVSTNASAALGQTLVLGQALMLNALPRPLDRHVADWLRTPADEEPTFDPFDMVAGAERYDVVAHQNVDGLIVIEFERCALEQSFLTQSLHRSYRSIEQLRRQRSVEGLLTLAVREVRRVTGFDRVMAYRFHPDDSGEIVREERRADLDDWEGRRYPAADIPAQARRLYTVNTLRLIADAHYQPVRILADRADATPLDLSHSVLRSVSPIHIEYMNNMGVRASMSISLVIGGKLWGMIACHHLSPRHVPYSVRMACEVLAQVLSASISTFESAARAERRRIDSALISRLTERASDQDDMHLALTRGDETPAHLLPCDAALCLWGNSVTVFSGIAPRGELTGILAALDKSGQRMVISTSIQRDFPELQTELVPYAGLMACKFDTLANGWLVWLRKEQVETLVWGGKPEKQYAYGTQGPRLTPRGSFEAWRETVRHTSLPWLAHEVEAADDLRDELSHISASRVADIDRARTALLAMLGHDLRDPLQSISMAATLLSRTDAGVKMGERIRYSSGRMQRLISQVLDLSRLQGGVGLGLQHGLCDLSQLIANLIDEKRHAFPGVMILPEVEPELILWADADRIVQVLANLLSNARQHGTQRQPIRVHAQRAGDEVVLRVTNHGAPIPDDVRSHLFSAFKPESAGQSRNRSGLGLGLYIADQIVRAHEGTLVLSCGDGLVTFTVTLPAAQGMDAGDTPDPSHTPGGTS
ncbi:ATP-binding protein [Bordetella genomosp. 1]|uniref:histidine kinase n=1 Tax=Bordetella genomosp. 1 TaxID=1395607 RepID=A0ABX4EUU9_9BORD|nr:ATP-binding protein [Bordetella genomosp. 1]OZI58014.1 histidine kinase [Bordetella genomosp. 1]